MTTNTDKIYTDTLEKEYYFPVPSEKLFRFLSEASSVKDLVSIYNYLHSNYWVRRKEINEAYKDAINICYASRVAKNELFGLILKAMLLICPQIEDLRDLTFQEFLDAASLQVPEIHDAPSLHKTWGAYASKYFFEIKTIFDFSRALASWMDYSTERIVSKSNHCKKAAKTRWEKNQEKMHICINGGDSPENQKNTDYKEYYSYINNCNTLLTNQKLETPKLEKKAEELRFVVPLRMRKKIN